MTKDRDSLRGLDSVRILKADLLGKIGKNREEHRTIFEEALDGWKEAVTTALKESYQAALDGKDFRLHINLVRPQDHTDEYDTIIEMLKMSQDDELVLTQYDFACYVLDKWDWQGQFLTSSSAYVSSVSNKRLIEDKFKE